MRGQEYISENIFQAFLKAYQQFPDNTAVIFKKDSGSHSFSYSHLFSSSKKLAYVLSLMGVKRGQRVAIVLENGPYWPLAFFSIMGIQAVAVPVDAQLDFPRIKDIIFHSQSVLVITQNKFVQKYAKQWKDIKGIKTIDLDSPDILKKPSRFEKIPMYINFEKDKLAALFYTSGTTGEYKAVMLTHRNLLSNFYSIKKLNIFSPKDVIISILPLHHTYSFMATCLVPLLEGTTICYPESLSFKDISICMQENGVTLFTAVPQFFHKICAMVEDKINKKPLVSRLLLTGVINCCWVLSKVTRKNYAKLIFKDVHCLFGERLKIMISGGARLDPKANARLTKWGFKILEGYGLTETSPVVSISPLASPKVGSIGKPIPDVRVKLVNKNAEGVGEVAIRGDNVMLGYYRLPNVTSKVFDRDWFLSGDLGYFDKRGYLYLVGRNNDMIVLSSGKNINPEELEMHYSHRFIKEICIIGQKGAIYGQDKQMIAVIVPDEEYMRSCGEVDIRGRVKWVLDGLSQQLPSYKRINGFVLTKTELPKTRLGKVKRYELSQKLVEGKFKDSDEPGTQEQLSRFEENALEYLSKFLKKKLKMADHLELDLGLDSLDRIELLSSLQELFSVEVPDDLALKLFESRTVGELITYSQNIVADDAFEKLTHRDEDVFWSDIFKTPPLQGTTDSIKLVLSLFDNCISFLLVIIIKSIFKIFFLLKVEGKNNIPKEGPFIIVANHTTYLDGLIVASSLPFRLILNTYFVGMGPIFRHPLLSWSTNICRIIPIDININLAETLKACNFLLEKGKILCYFPEGQRSADGLLTTFKKGIGILVKESTVKELSILPIYISGAYQVWGRHMKVPRLSRIKVMIAPLLKGNELVVENVSSPYATVAENLRIKIATLKEHISKK